MGSHVYWIMWNDRMIRSTFNALVSHDIRSQFRSSQWLLVIGPMLCCLYIFKRLFDWHFAKSQEDNYFRSTKDQIRETNILLQRNPNSYLTYIHMYTHFSYFILLFFLDSLIDLSVGQLILRIQYCISTKI